MPTRYRHIITACCFVMTFVNLGFCNTSFSVYQPYIVMIPGVGDAGGSLVITIRTLSVLVVMAFANVYYRKLGLRFGIFIATLCTAAAFLAFSRSTSLVGLCVGAAFAGCGVGLGTMIALTMLLNRWHPDNVGTAIGIASTGSAAASVIIPPLATVAIHELSLATSFAIEAGVAAIIAVGLLLAVRSNPKDGAQSTSDTPSSKGSKRASSTSPSHKPLTKRAHQVVGFGLFCLGMMTYSGLAYLGILISDEGFDPVFVAAMISLYSGLLAASKFAVGFTFDHLGTFKGSAIFFALTLSGLACLALMPLHSPLIAIAGSTLYGLGNGISSTGVSMWSIELADPGNADRSIRNFQLVFTVGGFCFTIVPGIIKTFLGTYAIAYGILFIACLTAATIILTTYRRYRS